MRRRPSPRSPSGFLWVAAYGACVLLVLSFILFEVLDVDGSDVASPLHAAATLKVADPTPELRRAPSLAPTPIAFVAPNARVEQLHVRPRVADASAAVPAHAGVRRGTRHALARALLADPAPSA